VGYKIEFRPSALRDLKALPREILQRVSEKVSALAENPRPVGVEKLSGSEEDFYRIRVGDYRVLYTIQDGIGGCKLLILNGRHADLNCGPPAPKPEKLCFG
jgi:mRNA interferase RelE/StbE